MYTRPDGQAQAKGASGSKECIKFGKIEIIHFYHES